MKISAIGALVLGLAVLGGCDHKVSLTFINTTNQVREVEVDEPGKGKNFVGTLASGQKRRTNIKIDKNDLPAEVAWSADDISGSFTVDKHVKERVIYIEPSGSTTIDKKTEIDRKESTQQVPRKVGEQEVIE